MKKDETIQLMYDFMYFQISNLWTMEKLINAFNITRKHNMANDQ